MKNPAQYSYSGEEAITISGSEFLLLKGAIEQGINATLINFLPEVTKYINIEDSSIVESPSKEDLVSGKVVIVTDKDATFNGDNVRSFYGEKLTPQMIQGQELIMTIHERNVTDGVAKSFEDLEKK